MSSFTGVKVVLYNLDLESPNLYSAFQPLVDTAGRGASLVTPPMQGAKKSFKAQQLTPDAWSLEELHGLSEPVLVETVSVEMVLVTSSLIDGHLAFVDG